MNACPCCSSLLLRHIRHHRIYWFCPHCWQDMPILESPHLELHREFELLKKQATTCSSHSHSALSLAKG